MKNIILRCVSVILTVLVLVLIIWLSLSFIDEMKNLTIKNSNGWKGADYDISISFEKADDIIGYQAVTGKLNDYDVYYDWNNQTSTLYCYDRCRYRCELFNACYEKVGNKLLLKYISTTEYYQNESLPTELVLIRGDGDV